ncbi:helix-turn-helix transcriptional regulator [Streptomyces sp. NPDC018347]|uniref:helix-turn-helix domain-containing protein n=1 Tax=Streptomyces sp. NPDC018347 TaxID=3157193 RepID=UPI0033E51940
MPESGFAELLRELKNRSGHSYGALAKRLHMSTSTLHRYCNGDAVPADYAPVERLARLCKATPAELVELHRRWVLADAVRGRKGPEREAGAVAAAVAPPEPGAAPREEPKPVSPPPESESESEPVPKPVSVGGSRPGPDPDPGPKSDPDPKSESEAKPSAGVGRRRRTALLAALTVTALLGGVAVALNLSSGDGEQDGKAAPAAVATAVTSDASRTAAPHRTPSTPMSGSPAPHRSATRSASPPAKTPDAAAGGTGEPAASATGRASTAPPLTVTTRPYSWVDPCSQHYLIDRPPTGVAPPPLEQDAPAWVAVHQAVSAGEQFVTFTVQGTGKETVVLERLSVRMAGKRSPLAWNDYAMGYPGVGCGGGVPSRSFSVALDAMRPAPVPAAGSADFPFKVSQSDPEVFYITADASAYDVSWYLELTWSSGSRHGTLLIDDAGRPFRTSGNNGRPAYAFPLGGAKWKPASETG